MLSAFFSYTYDQVTVKLGLYSLVGSNPNSVSSSLIKAIKHPNYNSQTNDNDLSLLQLSSTVSFNNYITPVCLAATGSTFNNGTLIWVTGWGNIGSEVSLPSPGKLQEVQVPIIGNRMCNCLYGVGTINNDMLCAGFLQGGKDSCQGDSGGPLVIKQGSQWIQTGIVSFGNKCALPNYPGVYTSVSQYQNWISQTINTNQPGFIKYTSSGTDSDLQVNCKGLPTVPPTTVPSVVCGSAKLNTLSGTGSPLASAGTWPWMASLQLNGTHICGGTLIAQQFVMSSADCFSSTNNPSDWSVKLGRLNQTGLNPNEVTVAVANITFSTNGSNNIAVLKLSTTPTLSDFIQPICVNLASTNFNIGSQCWAAGWGSGGGAQQTLQQFNMTIVDCGNASSSSSICTQVIPLEQTERGGPLMCKIGQTWIQAAVLTLTSNSTNSTTNFINSSNNTTNLTNNSDSNTNSTASSNSTINSTTSSNSTTNSTTSSNSSTNSTTSSNSTTNFTTSSNSTTNSTTSSNSTTNSTTSSNSTTNSTTSSNSTTNSTTSSNSTTNSTTSSDSTTNSTTGSNSTTNSTTGLNSTTNFTTSSNSTTNSTTSSNSNTNSTTSSNSTTNSTTSSNNTTNSTTSSNNTTNSTTSSNSTTNSTTSSNSTTNSTTSSNSTTNSTTSSNNTTNSTNTTNTTSGSIKILLEGSPRAPNIQTFTTTSRSGNR
ncbi:polyserase-2-like [Clarias gariepinus]|uniref:transmembrane protease serine 9-like n=1 Tax=Clarias gariepinus TaxID=13013 RepID=UPI00234D22EE|nr:transmembrane protease serine 9-like [Clarias gariepinus]